MFIRYQLYNFFRVLRACRLYDLPYYVRYFRRVYFDFLQLLAYGNKFYQYRADSIDNGSECRCHSVLVSFGFP